MSEASELPSKSKEPVVAEELDLSGYTSSRELEDLGMDRLQAALIFLGVT